VRPRAWPRLFSAAASSWVSFSSRVLSQNFNFLWEGSAVTNFKNQQQTAVSLLLVFLNLSSTIDDYPYLKIAKTLHVHFEVLF
jgi:hypothetical protein